MITKSKCIRLVLFFGILFALLSVMSFVFFPKDCGKENGMDRARIKGFLAEPKDSIDVLAIGNSLAGYDISPMEIWNNTGIPVYNCGMGEEKINHSLEYINLVYQYHHPKVVILETDIIFRHITLDNIIMQNVEQILPIFRYHDLWKLENFSQLFHPVHYTNKSLTKGQVLTMGVEPIEEEVLAEYQKRTDECRELPQYNSTYVRWFYNACIQNNAQLILFSSPSPVCWTSEKHNRMEQLAEELHVPYVDMNLIPDAISIDWETDTPDGGDHLNYYGTKKLNAWLGAYLQNMGLFEDKRSDPEFASWNEDYACYVSELGVED